MKGARGRGRPFTVDHWPSGSSLRSSDCDIVVSTTANWFDHWRLFDIRQPRSRNFLTLCNSPRSLVLSTENRARLCKVSYYSLRELLKKIGEIRENDDAILKRRGCKSAKSYRHFEILQFFVNSIKNCSSKMS